MMPIKFNFAFQNVTAVCNVKRGDGTQPRNVEKKKKKKKTLIVPFGQGCIITRYCA